MVKEVKWIKNKIGFLCSLVLLGVCMYLYFPFPNNVMIEAKATFMSFPIKNQDGYLPTGIVGAFLFIAALIFLFRSLTKYQARTILIVMTLYMILPSVLISAYQEILAKGVSAISYDNHGQCNVEIADQKMNGTCNLILHNRSNEAVTFELEFINSSFQDDMQMESLMNLAGPYKITMKANEKKPIQMNEFLDLSEVHPHPDGGGSFNVHIKLTDSGKTRTL